MNNTVEIMEESMVRRMDRRRAELALKEEEKKSKTAEFFYKKYVKGGCKDKRLAWLLQTFYGEDGDIAEWDMGDPEVRIQ